jgi:hypothetical protein
VYRNVLCMGIVNVPFMQILGLIMVLIIATLVIFGGGILYIKRCKSVWKCI